MRVFVTGGTGMLGQELVPRLLDRGHEVVVLTRRTRRPSRPGLSYQQGDITETIPRHPGARLDAVLHLAASTNLRPRDFGVVWDANVSGTENVLRFAIESGVPRFIHCSTLFVSGDIHDRFGEDDLERGQVLKNPYELTKMAAELTVRRSPLDLTILRPGILIGRHSDGHAAFFEGFYRPIRAIALTHRFAEQKIFLPRRETLERTLHLPPLHLPVRIYGDPDSRLALTPVDWAANVMADLVDAACGTYHVVPEQPPTMREIANAINGAFNVTGVHVGPGPTRNPLDIFYNRLIRDFHPYLKAQPAFDTTVGVGCPPVDESYIERAILYWREHGRRTRPELEGTGVGLAGYAQRHG